MRILFVMIVSQKIEKHIPTNSNFFLANYDVYRLHTYCNHKIIAINQLQESREEAGYGSAQAPRGHAGPAV